MLALTLNIARPHWSAASHVTAKTKAGRKSGCQIDPGHAVWGERGSQAAGTADTTATTT